MSPDGVPFTIIDTSSRPEDSDKVDEELLAADVIILTYACDRQATLESLTAFWLPRLRDLGVKVPVIVAACKLQHENQKAGIEEAMQPVMQQFPEIEISIGCSASMNLKVLDVFSFAQKSVLYPLEPLYFRNSNTLKPRFARALKRIFILSDRNRDSSLNNAEFNDFQAKYFIGPVPQSAIQLLVKYLRKKYPEGVNEHGLTLAGFQSLHADFKKIWHREVPWAMLRKFGYMDDIRLADHLIPPLTRAPDQSVELTNEALAFLKKVFVEFDVDCNGILQPEELEELFFTAPESPWTGPPYKDAADENVVGENGITGLSLEAFLSKWALMTLIDPTFSVKNLLYIGYTGDPSSAIRVTRRRSFDRKLQHSERDVIQCFVFGPRSAGKSSLLKSFIRWPYSEIYNPTNEDHYAVNVVDDSMGKKKYLVLREIPEDGVKGLLANKESLASCDIAIIVHDRSDESSWRASSKLLVDIAAHGEDSGFEVPCLIVAAKDDQVSFTMAAQESTRVSQDMGVEAPIPISLLLGNLNDLFLRIVTAATKHPHLSIPETDVGKSRKLYTRLVNNTVLFVSVGAAVAIVGVTLFSAGKNAQVS
ncbi:putative EF-hand domain pair, mitochondrial Rho GTPase [Medicago truncatula]|nr:mitochondrial Rho GTPase 1 [Medicago truncatula]RHN64833.1 putative EF-hand domain pair, mitochondrial Rho GTPase [Medicago truncatula]